jgi:hypothetical protein
MGKNSGGTLLTPASGDFDSNLLEQNDTNFFIAPHAVVVTSIGVVGAVSYANDWEIQFWRMNFDDNDAVADSIYQIGSTISFTGNTTYMINKQEASLSVALAATDCVFTWVRYTSGSTNKTISLNTVIQYHNA